MRPGRAAALGLIVALAVSGCSVARLPETAATGQQTETQHRLDVADCKAEVGYRHNYNGDDSPLANALRNVFVLGTGGAAFGGFLTGLPTTVATSTASEGLIAGAGAGGIAGGAISVAGRSRFEREWIACMESRGYRIVATPRPIH
jgi:hypothetical protein